MDFKDLSTAELIASALTEKDEEKRWELVTVLHKRGSREVFLAARNLCESAESIEITLGADVLGQLGTPEFPFKKESLPVLLNLAESAISSSDKEGDESALQSVVFALGRMEDAAARRKILEFAHHRSADVRFAVAYGLLGIDEDAEIKALIELSGDADEDVRNWATFALGSLIDRDTEEIREALVRRLNEDDGETGAEIRGEALVGLAVRKDERVVEPLL